MRPEHFAIAAEALLWTLEQGLSEAFTPDVRDAWVAAWNLIADAMLTGMRQAELGGGHQDDSDLKLVDSNTLGGYITS